MASPDRSSAATTREAYCGAFYGPPLPPIGEPAECGFTFTVEQDDPVEPTCWFPCPRCGADCEVEW